MSSPSAKVLEKGTYPKPLAIYAPAKAGSSVVDRFMISIEKFSRWSRFKLPLMTGPIRHFNMKHDHKYVLQLRNPLDHLVSKYYSECWIHPYLGNEKDKKKWDEDREKVQKQTIDEYCLNMLQQGRHLEQHLRILNASKYLNCTCVTYEEMMLNYEWWGQRFLHPFDITPENRLRIIKDHQHFTESSMVMIDPDTGDLVEHKRDGRPGEFQEQLKPMTVKILKDAYKDVIKHIIDHTEADLGFLE